MRQKWWYSEENTNRFAAMTKRIKFGPGHPVYDAQLPLFPDMSDPRQNDAGFQIRDIPCPACFDVQLWDTLHAPMAALDLPNAGKDNCASCKGSGIGRVKLKQAEGCWWDIVGRTLIVATSQEQACKQANGRKVVPFLVEFGGYSPSN